MRFPERAAIALMCLSLLSWANAARAQDYDDPLDHTGECRAVVEDAEVDGVTQPVAARACLGSDGFWQIVRDNDASVIVYPTAAYPYADPWYYGPPIFVGVGASFVFIDRFHHFHHFFRAGHGHFGGFHPGFHPNAGSPHGFHSFGGMNGGTHGSGGGHHR